MQLRRVKVVQRKHKGSVLVGNKGYDHFCLLSAVFWSAELPGRRNCRALRCRREFRQPRAPAPVQAPHGVFRPAHNFPRKLIGPMTFLSVLSCQASCRKCEAGGKSDPDPEGGAGQRGLPRLTLCFQDTPWSSPKCNTALGTLGILQGQDEGLSPSGQTQISQGL